MTAGIPETPAVERPAMDVDIACVGFGPAMAGFLTTLSKRLADPAALPALESGVAPGMPAQVVCYERADDAGFGVSGVVTRARGIRNSYAALNPSDIPMAAAVTSEKMVYLLDPVGASRRSFVVRSADRMIRLFKPLLPCEHDALELPWTPAFLHKKDGLVLSMGQFMQWVATQVQSTGAVQIWPGTPVAKALIENNRVTGVRLIDQGVEKNGQATDHFTPGMDIHAALTVVGDGPVGPVGRQLDEHFGLPADHHIRDWAVGMKFVVDLPADTTLQPGTVLHTFGYPEPEIFGFFYVHPDRVASLGIFVPSWFESPMRATYRYLQHWMQHPWLWRYLKGGKLRSWGAKTLGESGRRGEPWLAGDGYARIGEGSGSTNVLTGSGVDEAWVTGTLLAEAVADLLRAKKPFTKQNLEETYVRRRRESWVERESLVAEKSRDGFQHGLVPGLVTMALAGLTGGRLQPGATPPPPWKHVPTIEEYYRGRIAPEEIERLRRECAGKGLALHDALMEKAGWPAIVCDGQLLVSHQDALLLGGKVQAPAGYADHVVFLHPELCERCGAKVCIEVCSGQAIAPGERGGVPSFDREKCIHCGACIWNCSQPIPGGGDRGNIAFRAGAGGLHSAEN
jgi:electron-transferring-flavoprotein dehydrogenase